MSFLSPYLLDSLPINPPCTMAIIIPTTNNNPATSMGIALNLYIRYIGTLMLNPLNTKFAIQ